jgi:hypothetical protein
MTKPNKKRRQSFDEEKGSEPSGNPSQSSSSTAIAPRKTAKAKSDQKLDLILKFATIENQNSVIVSKVKDIEVRVESAEVNIKLVRDDCDLLTNTVIKLQADLSSNGVCTTPQIIAIESSISSLYSDSSAHQNEHELLYADVNKLNLLIAGITEHPQENDSFAALEVQLITVSVS